MAAAAAAAEESPLIQQLSVSALERTNCAAGKGEERRKQSLTAAAAPGWVWAGAFSPRSEILGFWENASHLGAV